MSRQGRLLAGQAVLSALILIVVYVTLLRPEDGGSLSAVEAPQPSFPEQGDDRQRADRGADDRADSDRRTFAGAPSLLETGQLPTPTVGVPQPTDDQYSDTLGQLRARLGAG